MKRNMVGIDIGHDSLKLAYIVNGEVTTVVDEKMPDHLIHNGRVLSAAAMGELIKNVMKECQIKCRNASFVLNADNVYVKNVSMPIMTEEQLKYNLPFEFRDYITGETGSYIFDYAMLTTPEEIIEKVRNSRKEAKHDLFGSDEASVMELMACAIPKKLLEEYQDIAHKAGMKLKMAAPAVSGLLNAVNTAENNKDKEFCIIDFGFTSIRIYMFKGEKHMATRILEAGMSQLNEAVADEYGVDEHLAGAYFASNHLNCQNLEKCINIYNNIAIEITRALNFYRFSNPESDLQDLWLCGGGTAIPSLRRILDHQLEGHIHFADELFHGDLNIENAEAFVQAVGIAL